MSRYGYQGNAGAAPTNNQQQISLMARWRAERLEGQMGREGALALNWYATHKSPGTIPFPGPCSHPPEYPRRPRNVDRSRLKAEATLT